ncbi:hypothetical protein SULI_03175 [Saccharolobus solfataricus]|uniref:Uncharacterized protein n=3 Tax=Saccharolobus solfataricus TaxID=2287 RepID=Q97V24_SACS2|nr:hypothetical protein [Saccharolobus solfataricus]AAK42923.1 Hypothetical protein SSO2812 [Saccharolobus solfataricus P2]AKA73014.1 hypothetical protein SULB_0622 [Saccharolobus solfataricus]AKA75712.1 hypothetical protein SULC_0620 [Saccharolobus solfataricus]AKA78404.1 hypothetical protein SULA_0620 [Saccharolobus solfataricus]AZF67523.1 hypothetical protein SULG_03175 [Saccharolobus solfataricus]
MKWYQILIIVVAVILVISGIVILVHNTSQQQINVTKVVFPTQAQISSILGNGWNITGLFEENYSSAVNQQYPGGSALYQEYIQRANQTITLNVIQLNSTSTTLKGIKLGKYLVSANITGNSSKFDLSNIVNLEIETLKSGNGLMPTLNPLLFPANQSVSLLEFGNAITKNYTIYFETIMYNNSYISIDIANSSNISSLFTYLLKSTGQNVTVSSINGMKYFNLSFISQYGSVYYFVGINNNDNYLIFIQSQTPKAFQFFVEISTKV